jgi:hypothetical protein
LSSLWNEEAWLVHRLSRFAEAHPAIDLRVRHLTAALSVKDSQTARLKRGIVPSIAWA